MDYLCDHCGKSVCASHRHDATMPRLVDRDRDAAIQAGVFHLWPQDADGNAVPPGGRHRTAFRPDVCKTCRLLEEALGRAIEEVTAEERGAFVFSDDAVGYVGEHEYAEFEQLREYHARIHGEERKP